MNAADAFKEAVRVASTAGLSKDVIDLLDKKAALLAEQVTALEQENTALLRENRNLKLENENLKAQLQNARPKGDELEEGCVQMLIAIANFSGLITTDEIFRQLGVPKVQGDHWFDQLTKRKFIDFGCFATDAGSPISATALGREYLAKKGLLQAAPSRPLAQQPRPSPFGGYNLY